MYFSKKSSVYSWALIRQTKYLLMMTKKRSTKIVNFFIPVAGGLVQGYGRISHSVKMHSFFIRLLFYFRALIRQTKYIVIMTNKCLQKSWIRKRKYLVMLTKEASTKIVDFMTSEYALSSTLSILSTLIAIIV